MGAAPEMIFAPESDVRPIAKGSATVTGRDLMMLPAEVPALQIPGTLPGVTAGVTACALPAFLEILLQTKAADAVNHSGSESLTANTVNPV